MRIYYCIINASRATCTCASRFACRTNPFLFFIFFSNRIVLLVLISNVALLINNTRLWVHWDSKKGKTKSAPHIDRMGRDFFFCAAPEYKKKRIKHGNTHGYTRCPSEPPHIFSHKRARKHVKRDSDRQPQDSFRKKNS